MHSHYLEKRLSFEFKSTFSHSAYISTPLLVHLFHSHWRLLHLCLFSLFIVLAICSKPIKVFIQRSVCQSGPRRKEGASNLRSSSSSLLIHVFWLSCDSCVGFAGVPGSQRRGARPDAVRPSAQTTTGAGGAGPDHEAAQDTCPSGRFFPGF